MMGVKDGYVTDVPGLNRQQKLTILGNGVVPHQAVLALKMLLKERPVMADAPQMIPLDQLHPHPDNPRLAPRDDVVDAIAAEISRHGGFDRAYALKVRPSADGGYQIISGHNRRLAAVKAELAELPCWVDDTMDDATAFMQLVLSNSQAELSPLEVGFHALTYEKGGGQLVQYAISIGKDKSYITQLRGAASVAHMSRDSDVETSQLLTRTWQLYEISKAPASVHGMLLHKMLASGWTVSDTAEHVKAIRELHTVLEENKGHEQWLPFAEVAEENLDSGRLGSTAVRRLVTAATETAKWMRTAFEDPTPEVQGFFSWLIANKGGEAWDARQILGYKRRAEARLAAEQESHYVAQGWHHGPWQDHVDNLQDSSVALILTDPPYGQSFQSNMRKEKLDRIAGDEDADTAAKLLSDSLEALKPKLAADAHLLVFCGWRNELVMRQVVEDAGFEIKGSLIWDKMAPSMGDLEGAFAPSHERIIHAVQGTPILYRRAQDVLSYSRVKSDRHPTEKPEDLLKELIEVTTTENQLVADPFGGVASTPAAAKAAGRRWWACEVEEKYWRAGEERLLT
jgi:site-specific DNA-methyltransferase (adenine-specific)